MVNVKLLFIDSLEMCKTCAEAYVYLLRIFPYSVYKWEKNDRISI